MIEAVIGIIFLIAFFGIFVFADVFLRKGQSADRRYSNDATDTGAIGDGNGGGI
jgi:hypothetical protein